MVDEVTMEPIILDQTDQGKLPIARDDQNEDLREEDDPLEALPPGEADSDIPLTPEEMERLYDQFEMEDDSKQDTWTTTLVNTT